MGLNRHNSLQVRDTAIQRLYDNAVDSALAVTEPMVLILYRNYLLQTPDKDCLTIEDWYKLQP